MGSGRSLRSPEGTVGLDQWPRDRPGSFLGSFQPPKANPGEVVAALQGPVSSLEDSLIPTPPLGLFALLKVYGKR